MSLSYIYKDRLLRQITLHNTNSGVQIPGFHLKAIKYHTCVDIKIMMDNDFRPVHERKVRQHGTDEQITNRASQRFFK